MYLFIHLHVYIIKYTSQSDNVTLRTTLAALASFSTFFLQSVCFTCYPQVCFGSVTV